jgi:hypothetical protein
MNSANVYQPIYSQNGPAPLMLRVITSTSNQIMAGGSSGVSEKIDDYVQLRVLPDELRQRVELAIQALMTSR